MINLFKSEPYKILFAIGALCSILGVGQWIFFYFGFITEYPIKAHSQLMILGFIFSFVSGFLMTAVPRMTGTHSASLIEKCVASILVFIFFTLCLLGYHDLSFLASTSLFLFLISYFVRRKMKMKSRGLPSGFIFIPLGLGSGLIGSALIFMSSHGWISSLGIGKLLLYEGFILNLIIGLGSRLIPMLTRKSGALSPVEVNELTHRLFLTEAILFNGSFFLEEFVSREFGLLVRALVMSFVLYKNFRFFKPSLEKTKLGFSISAAVLFFPVSYFLILLFPVYKAQIVHLLYISGIAALTLLVSVRVSLAHGGSSLEIEKSSNAVLALAGSFFAASLVRIIGSIYGGVQTLAMYAAAGFIFLAGLLIWGLFLRESLFTGANDTEKC